MTLSFGDIRGLREIRLLQGKPGVALSTVSRSD
jgi:hypothetical protein